MIIGNNSDNFRNPARFYGNLATSSLYFCNGFGAKKNSDFIFGYLNSIPEGYNTRAYRWPTVIGSMSTFNNNTLSVLDNINNFALGNPMQSSITGNISNNAFQIALLSFFQSSISGSISLTSYNISILQRIQSAITGNIAISNGDLSIFAAVLMQANLTGGVGFSGADLGAVFDMLANLNAAISANASATMLADLSATIGGADPLSPQGLAQAVWGTLANNYDTSTGTFGYQLAHSGSGLSATDIANEVWNKTITALTAGQLIEFIEAMNLKIDELHKLQGLNSTYPMTVTESSRTVAGITQNITGDGITTSTVTRA